MASGKHPQNTTFSWGDQKSDKTQQNNDNRNSQSKNNLNSQSRTWAHRNSNTHSQQQHAQSQTLAHHNNNTHWQQPQTQALAIYQSSNSNNNSNRNASTSRSYQQNRFPPSSFQSFQSFGGFGNHLRQLAGGFGGSGGMRGRKSKLKTVKNAFQIVFVPTYHESETKHSSAILNGDLSKSCVEYLNELNLTVSCEIESTTSIDRMLEKAYADVRGYHDKLQGYDHKKWKLCQAISRKGAPINKLQSIRSIQHEDQWSQDCDVIKSRLTNNPANGRRIVLYICNRARVQCLTELTWQIQPETYYNLLIDLGVAGWFVDPKLGETVYHALEHDNFTLGVNDDEHDSFMTPNPQLNGIAFDGNLQSMLSDVDLMKGQYGVEDYELQIKISKEETIVRQFLKAIAGHFQEFPKSFVCKVDVKSQYLSAFWHQLHLFQFEGYTGCVLLNTKFHCQQIMSSLGKFLVMSSHQVHGLFLAPIYHKICTHDMHLVEKLNDFLAQGIVCAFKELFAGVLEQELIDFLVKDDNDDQRCQWPKCRANCELSKADFDRRKEQGCAGHSCWKSEDDTIFWELKELLGRKQALRVWEESSTRKEMRITLSAVCWLDHLEGNKRFVEGMKTCVEMIVKQSDVNKWLNDNIFQVRVPTKSFVLKLLKNESDEEETNETITQVFKKTIQMFTSNSLHSFWILASGHRVVRSSDEALQLSAIVTDTTQKMSILKETDDKGNRRIIFKFPNQTDVQTVANFFSKEFSNFLW
eukprot:71876_1